LKLGLTSRTDIDGRQVPPFTIPDDFYRRYDGRGLWLMFAFRGTVTAVGMVQPLVKPPGAVYVHA
jgi:hypothetical protein